jgi:transposase-like protein
MEITHKSALFVLRRIRHGMGYDGGVKLQGTIEADEVFVGGKPRNRGRNKRGTGDKTPVVGMVARNGDVRFRMMDRLTAANVARVIAENVNLKSRLMSDESSAYAGIGREFSGGHHTTVHSRREYAKPGGIHSNTIESVFSLIKRGVMGTFHSVTPKHLPNYLNEFEFRWNTRRLDDGRRIARAIGFMDGKRLQYRESVDNPPYVVGAVTGQADAPF